MRAAVVRTDFEVSRAPNLENSADYPRGPGCLWMTPAGTRETSHPPGMRRAPIPPPVPWHPDRPHVQRAYRVDPDGETGPTPGQAAGRFWRAADLRRAAHRRGVVPAAVLRRRDGLGRAAMVRRAVVRRPGTRRRPPRRAAGGPHRQPLPPARCAAQQGEGAAPRPGGAPRPARHHRSALGRLRDAARGDAARGGHRSRHGLLQRPGVDRRGAPTREDPRDLDRRRPGSRRARRGRRPRRGCG